MTAVTLLVLALSGSGLNGGGAGGVPWVLPAYAGAVGFGLLLVRVERRAAEPMVPLDLLSDRMVAAVAGTGLLVGVAMFSAISYVPLFVQEGLGGSAVEAGRALTPLILGWVVTSVITGRVVLRIGYRPMVLAGLLCLTLGFGGLTRIDGQSSVWLLRADLMLMGAGMGMTMLSLVLAMQNVVARCHLGVATSFGQFTRSIGGAVGGSPDRQEAFQLEAALFSTAGQAPYEAVRTFRTYATARTYPPSTPNTAPKQTKPQVKDLAD